MIWSGLPPGLDQPPWSSRLFGEDWGLGVESMGRAMQLIVGCQEVSYQTVQSLIGLEVFLILFPFIVSSWSLRGGQSPVVAAHGYCGGKGGAGERHNLGFICLAAGSPLPLGHSAVSQGRAVAIPSVAAAAGEHGLGLTKPPCS